MRKPLIFQSAQLSVSSLDRNVVSVLLVNLIWTIPWGLVQPFISPYFFELSKGDYILTGLLNGLPYCSMIFSVFFFGWIVDKIGSKNVMMAGFLFFLILFFTLLVITDPFLFFIDYVIITSLLACFNPAILKYASLTDKDDIFGSLMASTSLGYFFGTVVSGFLFDPLGMNTLFFLALAACILGLVMTIFSHDLRPISQQELKGSPPLSDNVNSPGITSILLDSKILIVLFVIAILHSFQSSFSGMFITVYFIHELNAPALLIGVVFGIATLTGTAASHFSGKIGEKRGFKEILVMCYIGYFFVWGSFIISTSNYILPAIFYMLPVYIGLFIAGPALVTDHIPESKRGTCLGILGASHNFGFAAGTILGGVFAGFQGSFRFNFGVSAFFTLILIIIILLFVKNGKRGVKPT
ncbi:MAG: MFS transporter [Candidatus Heimdallarchaeota archaeon]|nr:MAG: MFS transporter [Candidatus Heimdallarchaeota archaeon]